MHTALVERKVAELRQTWDSLPDDDLLDLLDKLDQPEDEVEARWRKRTKMVAAIRDRRRIPPAGWCRRASRPESAQLCCEWTVCPTMTRGCWRP